MFKRRSISASFRRASGSTSATAGGRACSRAVATGVKDAAALTLRNRPTVLSRSFASRSTDTPPAAAPNGSKRSWDAPAFVGAALFFAGGLVGARLLAGAGLSSDNVKTPRSRLFCRSTISLVRGSEKQSLVWEREESTHIRVKCHYSGVSQKILVAL